MPTNTDARPMRRLCLLAGMAVLSACGGETPGASADAESRPAEPAADAGNDAMNDAGEWTALFNGRDLEGWRSYNAAEPGPGWVVEDGAIVLDVDDATEEMTAGDLVTERQFESFELALEWRISAGGNSGVFYRVREVPGHEVAYLTGIEMQILDDERHPDGRSAVTAAGSCYALYAPAEDALRPVGEWNEVRLVVDGDRVEHWLNGRKIVEYVIGSDDWNRRVAESKFADWEHFATSPKGHIALQDHTDRVWFRNIRIRELPR